MSAAASSVNVCIILTGQVALLLWAHGAQKNQYCVSLRRMSTRIA